MSEPARPDAPQPSPTRRDPLAKTSPPDSPAERSEQGTELDPAAAEAAKRAEQMALYEKELRENDWGHQPC